MASPFDDRGHLRSIPDFTSVSSTSTHTPSRSNRTGAMTFLDVHHPSRFANGRFVSERFERSSTGFLLGFAITLPRHYRMRPGHHPRHCLAPDRSARSSALPAYRPQPTQHRHAASQECSRDEQQQEARDHTHVDRRRRNRGSTESPSRDEKTGCSLSDFPGFLTWGPLDTTNRQK